MSRRVARTNRLAPVTEPLLVVITGPSGVGKTTVVELIQAAERQRPAEGISKRYHIALTATTRKPRTAERDGVDYYFVSPEQFDNMLAMGEFLEHAVVYGNRYGVPKRPLQQALADGMDVLLRTDVQGARYIKSVCPQALTIFLAPPSWEELERRLRSRATDGAEQLERRLEMARSEMAAADEFDHVLVNETIDQTAQRIEDITAKERRRARKPLQL